MITNKKRHVVLMSGGVDSTLTAAMLKTTKEDVHGVFVDTGCVDIIPSLHAARRAVTALEMPLHVVKMESLRLWQADQRHYIARRNMFFAMIAANYGGRIYMGGIKGDNCPDKSPQSFRAIEVALNRCVDESDEIEFVTSILWQHDKSQVVAEMVNLGRTSLLVEAYSCYRGEFVHCGDCNACLRRFAVYAWHGIEQTYKTDPRETVSANYYRQQIAEGNYSSNVPIAVMSKALES